MSKFTIPQLLATVAYFTATANSMPTIADVKTALAARDLQSPVEGLPACNSKETDPFWAKGQSRFKDGEGKLIGDDCDNGDGGKKHCWTEYFLVGYDESYGDWQQATGGSNCKDGDTCTEMIGSTGQTCETNGWSASTSVSAGFESMIGASMGVELTIGTSAEYTACDTSVNQRTCHWTGPGCFAIWTTSIIKNVHGYKRRVCNGPSDSPDANMPNQPARNGNHYTVGMQDFVIALPGPTHVNCDGSCDAGWTPPEKPNDVTEGLQPWQG